MGISSLVFREKGIRNELKIKEKGQFFKTSDEGAYTSQ